MNEPRPTPSFEEVGRQFQESEKLLRNAHKSLQKLLANEERASSRRVLP